MTLQQRVEVINNKLKLLQDAKNIVVWGGGQHTSELFKETELLSYKIKEIVDIDNRKWGKSFFGLIIKSPREVVWQNIDVVVISAPNYEKDIIDSLRKHYDYFGKVLSLYEEGNYTPFYLLYDETKSQIGYLGDYRSWKEAENDSIGYGDTNILEKVISAIEKVKNGEAAWERDSYLFYYEKYVHSICAPILRCALQNENQGVRVLDIGGSLGSTYFQNRKYLSDVFRMEYVIAEQDNFVEYGRRNLQNETLKFIKSTDDWEKFGRYDIILLSGSLGYIPFYDEIIIKIRNMQPRYIILDRLMIGSRRRICRQTVPKEIYLGSYPVVIFTENDIRSFFEPDYKMIENDISSVPEKAYFVDGQAEHKYYVFEYMGSPKISDD